MSQRETQVRLGGGIDVSLESINTCNIANTYEAHFVLVYDEWRDHRWWGWKTVRSWTATAAELPGWFGAADTRHRLKALLADAVRLYQDEPHANVIMSTVEKVGEER